MATVVPVPNTAVAPAVVAAAPNARPVSVVRSTDTAELVLTTAVAEATMEATPAEAVTRLRVLHASSIRVMALPAPDGRPPVLGSTLRLSGISTSPLSESLALNSVKPTTLPLRLPTSKPPFSMSLVLPA